jgi:hypothetical protein
MADFPKTSFYGEGQTDLRGPKGDKGDPGAQGDLGPRGPQGFQGDKGAPGTNGANGVNGKNAVYRFGMFAVLGIQAEEILMDHIVGQACTLGENFAGTVASCGTAPREIWTATISLNDKPIGTLTIQPDLTIVLAATVAGPIPLAFGDVVSLTAPEDPDEIVGRVRITFTGEL